MGRDNETTAVQLHSLLVSRGYTLSQYYFVLQACWTHQGSAYCQLIRKANKKGVARAREHVGDDFSEVIWTDEAIIQVESHWRFACRKHGIPPRSKPW